MLAIFSPPLFIAILRACIHSCTISPVGRASQATHLLNLCCSAALSVLEHVPSSNLAGMKKPCNCSTIMLIAHHGVSGRPLPLLINVCSTMARKFHQRLHTSKSLPPMATSSSSGLRLL